MRLRAAFAFGNPKRMPPFANYCKRILSYLRCLCRSHGLFKDQLQRFAEFAVYIHLHGG